MERVNYNFFNKRGKILDRKGFFSFVRIGWIVKNVKEEWLCI